MVSDRLAALAMLPDVRQSILTRTRTIIRTNYPALEAWLRSHDDILTWAAPVAGAIAYASYDLPIKSSKLVERIRTDRSVLLVPGDMFGLKKGLRFGFGYDIERTLKGARPRRRRAGRCRRRTLRSRDDVSVSLTRPGASPLPLAPQRRPDALEAATDSRRGLLLFTGPRSGP